MLMLILIFMFLHVQGNMRMYNNHDDVIAQHVYKYITAFVVVVVSVHWADGIKLMALFF